MKTNGTVSSRCDGNGRFSVSVLPGSRYKIFVNDRELVSNLWDGVIVSPDRATIRKPELTVTKGVPVEVHVTKGRGQKPIPNADIFFASIVPRKLGPQFWGRTDERGRFVASAPAGELKLRVNDGDWNQEKTIQIVEGKPARINLHRQYAEKQTIRGRLVLPPGATADQSNTTVTIAGMDGESEDTTTVTSDADGRFSAGIIAGRVSILASSPKEQFLGCGIVDVGKRQIEIPMQPTLRYEGRVVGSDGEPLPGVTVDLTARLFDRGREYPPGTPDFRKQYVELFGDRNVVTDAKGSFVIPRTPQRMELTIWLTRPGETVWAHLRRNTLSPARRVPRRRSGSARARQSRLSSRCRRLCAIAVLPESSASWSSLSEQAILSNHSSNLIYSIPKKPATTRPRQRTTTSIRTCRYSRADLKPRNCRIGGRTLPPATGASPGPDSLFLAAINGDGKELGRLSANVSNEQAAAKDVAAFIKTHLPKGRDAQSRLRRGTRGSQANASPSVGLRRADSLCSLLQFFTMAGFPARLAGEGLRPVQVR